MWKVALGSIVAAGFLLLTIQKTHAAEEDCDEYSKKEECNDTKSCYWRDRCLPVWGVLRAPDLKGIQKRLGVKKTGKLGPETRDAIRKLQKEKGLPDTGKLDLKTLRALGD